MQLVTTAACALLLAAPMVKTLTAASAEAPSAVAPNARLLRPLGDAEPDEAGDFRSVLTLAEAFGMVVMTLPSFEWLLRCHDQNRRYPFLYLEENSLSSGSLFPCPFGPIPLAQFIWPR